MAMPTPATLMVMPTPVCAKAGASFTPSRIITTVCNPSHTTTSLACQRDSKTGCVPKSSENLSGLANLLPGPVPFCFSSHSGAPQG
jgi:hypothetical protein